MVSVVTLPEPESKSITLASFDVLTWLTLWLMHLSIESKGPPPHGHIRASSDQPPHLCQFTVRTLLEHPGMLMTLTSPRGSH